MISASGHSSQVIGRGSIEMIINVRGKNTVFTLTDVMYVPNCNIQLISCKDLGRKGYAVSINDQFATVIDTATGEIALIAQSPGDGLTPVKYNLADDKAFSIDTTKLKLTLFEAHCLLGHVNYSILKRNIRGGHIHGIEIIGNWDEVECEQLTIAERKAKYVGHIVSADLIDCKGTPAHGGIKFMSVIIDLFSYVTSVMMLTEKSAESVLKHIQMFNAYLLSESGKSIRIFRSDRGLEYNNQLFQDYAAKEHTYKN